MLQARYLRDTGSFSLNKKAYAKFKTKKLLGTPIIYIRVSQTDLYIRETPEDDVTVLLKEEGIDRVEKFYDAVNQDYVIKFIMHPPGA
jgi:hypothetical protein